MNPKKLYASHIAKRKAKDKDIEIKKRKENGDSIVERNPQCTLINARTQPWPNFVVGLICSIGKAKGKRKGKGKGKGEGEGKGDCFE